MPLQRNEFIPASLLTVYTSPTGLIDPRTNQPYLAAGLYPGVYFDLTEAEAQRLSGNALHEGRYRFVQVDSAATAANIATGTIGLMKTLALGGNFITSYDKGLAAGMHPIVFLQQPTAAQISAGCYLFVQEMGSANVIMKSSLSNSSPNVGDIVNSVATGVLDDPSSQNWVASTVGIAQAVPAGGQYCRVLLDLPPYQD
jgi:hypothetical protein